MKRFARLFPATLFLVLLGVSPFDLERDPGERRNLFYEHQDKAKELQAKLDDRDKGMNQHKPRFIVT